MSFVGFGRIGLLAAIVVLVVWRIEAQTISTAVGGLIINNQPAASTPLANPRGLAFDGSGNLVILDTGNNLIRRVDAARRVTTTIAGGGSRLDDSLPIAALTANIPFPLFAATDQRGNIFFSDGSLRIRKLTPEGLVTTAVGNGRFGYSGNGGPALFAQIGPPYGMAFDAAGNLFFADCYNAVIRKVEAATGIIRTVVGNNTFGFSGDSGPATEAALSCPTGLAFDSSGDLYFVDANNYRLRKVDTRGIITTIAGNGVQERAPDGVLAGTNIPLWAPWDVAVDQAGNVYFSERFGLVRKIDAATGLLTTLAGGGTSSLDGIRGTAAFVGMPQQLFLDRSGGLYFADAGRNAVRRVELASGMITTIAGTDAVFDGSTAESVVLATPVKMAFDRAGNLLIADQAHNRIRKVDTLTRLVTTIAGTGQPGFGGDNGPATAALLQFPAGIATNAAGDVFISDTANHRIRKVDGRSGIITTMAGTGQIGSSGDRGAATQATVFNPDGLLLDSSGNLYFADAGNGLVRRINLASGVISTIAGNRQYGNSGDGGLATSASLTTPTDMAFDKMGNLLIADRNAHVVRKVDMATNVITTIAGTGQAGYSGDNGPATLARLSAPNALAAGPTGDVFIAERDNNVIRKIAVDTDIITTFSGTGRLGDTGDGGPASLATMNAPQGVALDSAGNLFFSDSGNNRIRKVIPAPVVPVLAVAPSTLLFISAEAGANPPAQTFHVLNTNFVGLSWSIQVEGTGTNWLTVSPTSGIAPSAVTLRVSAAGLAPGDHRATLVVRSPGAIGSPQTVSVGFTVERASPSAVALSTQLLSFQTVSGGINPTPQALAISNAGSGTLDWTATVRTGWGGDWLGLSAVSGTAPSSLFVSVNLRGLSEGVYQGSVIVQDRRGGSPATAVVLLLVTAPASAILLSHTGFQFAAVEGAAALPPQRFVVLNAGQGAMNWNALSSTTSEGGWLQVSPDAGISRSTDLANSPAVTVAVNAAGLRAGTYSGLITVSASGVVNSPQLVSVVLRVLAPGSSPPPLLESTGFLFVVLAGSENPVIQAVNVFQSGAALNFSASAATEGPGGWLSVTPASGRIQGSGALTLQVNPRRLEPAVYRATATLSFSNGSVQDVAILLIVTSGTVSTAAKASSGACLPAVQHLLATSMPNNFVLPQAWPQPVLVTVVDDCGTPVIGSAVSATFSNGDATILLVDHRNGTYTGTWTPQNPSERVKVTFQATHPTLRPGSLELGGSLGISGAPRIFSNGAVNAASFRRFAALAPGSIFSVFGQNLTSATNWSPGLPLPRSLGGFSLKLGSLEVPLFYTSSGQINAQVPFEAPENAKLPLLASFNNTLAGPEPVAISTVQPGVFTVNQTGTGQGAVLNANGVLVDGAAPASAGSVLQVFCTGLGATDPPAVSGEAAPTSPLRKVRQPVTAKIGGLDARVDFAGLAPGFVGLYQVNVVVPAGVAAGNEVTLLLVQNGVESNQVTIAVR